MLIFSHTHTQKISPKNFAKLEPVHPLILHYLEQIAPVKVLCLNHYHYGRLIPKLYEHLALDFNNTQEVLEGVKAVPKDVKKVAKGTQARMMRKEEALRMVKSIHFTDLGAACHLFVTHRRLEHFLVTQKEPVRKQWDAPSFPNIDHLHMTLHPVNRPAGGINRMIAEQYPHLDPRDIPDNSVLGRAFCQNVSPRHLALDIGEEAKGRDDLTYTPSRYDLLRPFIYWMYEYPPAHVPRPTHLTLYAHIEDPTGNVIAPYIPAISSEKVKASPVYIAFLYKLKEDKITTVDIAQAIWDHWKNTIKSSKNIWAKYLIDEEDVEAVRDAVEQIKIDTEDAFGSTWLIDLTSDRVLEDIIDVQDLIKTFDEYPQCDCHEIEQERKDRAARAQMDGGGNPMINERKGANDSDKVNEDSGRGTGGFRRAIRSLRSHLIP